MTKSTSLIAVIALLLALLPAPTSAQSIDENFYYKLSTQFRGNGMKLDVFNGGPKNNLTRTSPSVAISRVSSWSSFSPRKVMRSA